MFETLDDAQLARINAGANDPLGPTVLVAGRPQTLQALYARRDKLFERGNDPTISNERWMHQWKELNDAYQRFPRH
jgi:hypothetical protein